MLLVQNSSMGVWQCCAIRGREGFAQIGQYRTRLLIGSAAALLDEFVGFFQE